MLNINIIQKIGSEIVKKKVSQTNKNTLPNTELVYVSSLVHFHSIYSKQYTFKLPSTLFWPS